MASLLILGYILLSVVAIGIPSCQIGLIRSLSTSRMILGYYKVSD
jgi:hypothetical protein